MHISHKFDAMKVHDVVVAHRYENMVMYVSLVAFLAMMAVFLLILSL